MRRFLLTLVPVLLLAPSSADAEHCNGIAFYSGVRAGDIRSISWDPASSIGCSAGNHDNTDLILPGTSYGMVQVSSATEPEDGILEDGSISGSSLALGDTTVLLAWTRGLRADGSPANYWYSQLIDYDIARSVAPGFTATPQVCFEEEHCIERIYRTVTAV